MFQSDRGDEEVGIAALRLLPIGAGFCFPPKSLDLPLLGKTRVMTTTYPCILLILSATRAFPWLPVRNGNSIKNPSAHF